jgi:hypothetical protein
VPYSLDFGITYVGYDEVEDFQLLAPEQQVLLAAWADALIPGDSSWPSASATRAHLYADNCAARAPRLRALLLRAVRRLDALAGDQKGQRFSECDAEVRREILGEFERSDDADLFEFVLELIFEGYYRDPSVLEVVEARTGFRVRAPVDGTELEPFDEVLVETVKQRPSTLREVDS